MVPFIDLLKICQLKYYCRICASVYFTLFKKYRQWEYDGFMKKNQQSKIFIK